MTTQTFDTIDRERQARRMNRLNRFMRPVLSLPFPTPLSGSLMLAHLTGRRSGKQYRIPLSYIRDGDALLSPGGGRWKLNLVDGRPEQLRVRGKVAAYRPELVRDVDEVGRLLELMVSRGSRALDFSGIEQGADGHLNRAQLERAVAHGFAVVRWVPA